jgi:hypothetical protein
MATRCRVGGCERDVRAMGYCKRHYNHWHDWGNPLAGKFVERQPTWCAVPGCDGRAKVHSLCRVHDARVRRCGDVQADKPIKRRRAGGGRKPYRH